MYIHFLKQGNLSISIIKCNNYSEFSYFPQIVKCHLHKSDNFDTISY